VWGREHPLPCREPPTSGRLAIEGAMQYSQPALLTGKRGAVETLWALISGALGKQEGHNPSRALFLMGRSFI
jgi:hypothetical protein